MEIFTIKGSREFALSRYPDSSEPIAFPKNPTAEATPSIFPCQRKHPIFLLLLPEQVKI